MANMTDLTGKTLFITGGSRGIGEAIALRAARDGANICIAAKSDQPHSKLPGTIHSVAEKIRQAGGRALPLVMDVRFEDQVEQAVSRCVETFGGIDICINNASAISLTAVPDTDMKRYDLMQDINTRGTFLTSKTCLPHLLKAANPHVLTLSPPLNMDPRWFAAHPAYTISKYGMSMCMLGMAEAYRDLGVAFNALWPKTLINTAAVENLLGGREVTARSRSPKIVADAAHWILTRDSREFTGNFCIDEDVLRSAGVTDFSSYAVGPGVELIGDLFL